MPKDTFFNLDPDKQQRVIDAAIREFESHTYEEAKLSRIIKDADIARGSFYQYFEDKLDLYKHLFDRIAQDKLAYLGNDLNNPDEIGFIELFRRLYKRGVLFANEHPEYIRITRNLMLNRGTTVFKEILGDNYDLGRQYYKQYIEIDKNHGRIREDVDSDILADFILDTTTTIAFNELTHDDSLDLDKMFNRMEQMLKILQKGIQ